MIKIFIGVFLAAVAVQIQAKADDEAKNAFTSGPTKLQVCGKTVCTGEVDVMYNGEHVIGDAVCMESSCGSAEACANDESVYRDDNGNIKIKGQEDCDSKKPKDDEVRGR